MKPEDDPETCRIESEALLRRAASAIDMAERSRLIDQAVFWRLRADNAAADPAISDDLFDLLDDEVELPVQRTRRA
ncbi:MAG TPA: hypothetical protein VFW47_15195 [Phenylobacterium sp.]|nr:hypothetical protein [Phenylobacterium sp.]